MHARFRSLTGWADQATSPQDAVHLIAAALRAHERQRPLPWHVEVPFDLLEQDAEPDGRTSTSYQLRSPEPEEYGSAAAVLGAARSPVVWAGGGVVASGAFDELARVAERLAAPVVTTYLGRTAIPASHPLAVAISPHEPAVRRLRPLSTWRARWCAAPNGGRFHCTVRARSRMRKCCVI